MTVIRPRRTRSDTLLSTPSSYTRQPCLRLCLRKSLAGHWTLVDAKSHKSLYYISTPHSEEQYSTCEIRKEFLDGPVLAKISRQVSGSMCRLAFTDDQSEIELLLPGLLSFGRSQRFEAKGRQLCWKRDTVCRESNSRRIDAKTDGDTLLIYESPEELLDILIVGYIAMKFKHQ